MIVMSVIRNSWLCKFFFQHIMLNTTKLFLTEFCHFYILYNLCNKNTYWFLSYSNIFYVYKLKQNFNSKIKQPCSLFPQKCLLQLSIICSISIIRISLETMKLPLFNYKRNIDRNMFVNYTFLLISFTDICVDWLIVSVVCFRFLFHHCIYVTSVLRCVYRCVYWCLYLFLCIVGGDVQYVFDYF